MLNVAALQRRFRGALILPDDPSYDDARRSFNAMVDRRPALIARCSSASDVSAAVDFARDQRLRIAVRSGGHSVAGWSVCDDGVVIDLTGMKRIAIDATARTARAGGGVVWGEFDAATQAHGLLTPGGRVTTTGLGGFTTGGGYGWASSTFGLACDNLIGAEVVLADGRVVRADGQNSADLFWGIRGGGGNFGIVTEFEFRLHAVGPRLLAGLLLWPIEAAETIMRAWRHFADRAPDEVSTACAILTVPSAEPMPAALRGQVALGVVIMFVGDPADGAAALRPLRSLGAAADLIEPVPYSTFQASLDATAPAGLRNYWRGEYLSTLTDEAIATFVGRAPGLVAAGAPFSQVIMFRIGQAIAATPDDAMAFSPRSPRYLLHPLMLWRDESSDGPIITSSRAFCDAMRSFSTGGAYLNFTAEDRLADAFSTAKHQRLVALKDAYDPENLFRLNHNVVPSVDSRR